MRDVPLWDEADSYREGKGVQIMVTLRSLALIALRLDCYRSITEGLAALAHDIRGTSGTAGLARNSSETEFCMTSNEPWAEACTMDSKCWLYCGHWL